MVLLRFTVLILFVSVVKLQEHEINETNFVASSEWQEIKPGKFLLTILSPLKFISIFIFRPKSSSRVALQNKLDDWLKRS